MKDIKSWMDDSGKFIFWADEKDPAWIAHEKRVEAERKETLARFVSSIEGISDEDLHAMFVARAVKKAIWDESDLLMAIKDADREAGWTDKGEINFDELFKEVGEGA